MMWVIALLALSASTAASAEDCGADVGPGGEAQAAAELVLFLAWVFVGARPFPLIYFNPC